MLAAGGSFQIFAPPGHVSSVCDELAQTSQAGSKECAYHSSLEAIESLTTLDGSRLEARAEFDGGSVGLMATVASGVRVLIVAERPVTASRSAEASLSFARF
jgi:hypothetical protein